MSVPTCVLIVDDDEAARALVSQVADTLGYATQAHDSLESLFSQASFPPVGCALIELRLMTISSRAIHDRLLQKQAFLPLIYASDRLTIQTAVDVIRAGAEAIVEKPIDTALLADEMRKAVALSRLDRLPELRRDELRQRLALLTPREQEVLALVMLGKTSREIAGDIHRSAKTIELHRAHILHKLGARNAMELVRDLTKMEGDDRTST